PAPAKPARVSVAAAPVVRVSRPAGQAFDAWPAVRHEYETTTESVSRIAARHGLSHTAINKKADKEGWTNPRKRTQAG
ncbi:MAG: hypothetical protein WCC64_03705, partial [Aliidongia sp.]